MKICPTCKETYKDDELNYCLADGATLVNRKDGATKPQSLANEIVAIVLLLAAVLVFLCLVSASWTDASPNSTGFGSNARTQNWIGVVGAWIADWLFQAAGVVAYLLPAMLALIAWRVFQSYDLKPSPHRVVGFLLFVASAAGLVNMIGWQGGMIGAVYAVYASYLLGSVGALILMVATFAISILLITNLSFIWFFGSFEMARENFKIHFDEWRAKRRELRADDINAAKERQDKRLKSRAGKSLTTEPPSTIVVPDSVAKRTKANAAAAGTILIPDEEQPYRSLDVPTIAPPDLGQEKAEKPAKKAKDETAATGEIVDETIPIVPVAKTGELSDEALPEEEAVDEIVVEEPLPMTGNAQNYDHYVLPSSQLLTPAAPRIEAKEKELLEIADSLVEKTKEFNVSGKVVHITPGPVVTTYEFKPDPGVKYSRVTGLVDDLCLALKAESIRIDRIPGKAFVGIEVPNRVRETIQLRDVVESKKFKESQSLLTIALGKTIDGLNYVADLAKMPHLLIAGATGAGKSVGVNSLVVSILYKAKPNEVKFIMVDPKRLELGLYADIPHLATPIITDPKRAAISLKWAVTEMERRYKDLAGYGVRNIDGYNAEAKRRNALEQWDDNGDPHRILPFIVIIIDELADLMMVSGKEVEDSITRLAQMARAVGIHLVLATQRPSVDVITGLIKANFPARISFRVSSKVDSRTIIDGNGAEGLLGRGDMLFLPPASSQVIRVHGAYVDEKEIGRIVDQVKAQGRPEYDTTITKSDEELDDAGDLPGRKDPLFWDALKCVVGAKRGSTSLLQRHLRIGYGRAAAILDAMVKEGYIGDMDGSTRARPILQKAYDDLQDVVEMQQSNGL
jgi:S-DNA-T family DNA segregation ATPase FtsK/SpoIIIE